MLIRTDSLSKHYRNLQALNDCTLQLKAGEVFGLLGPNGSGKTTLLRLLMGYLRPTSGIAQIDGLDCYRQSVEVHRRVAYLPGETRLFPEMRGRDVLRFFAEVRGDRNFERSLQLARRLDLDLARRTSQMSTGMKQKVALVAVLSAETPLIILDEPTSNLDPTIRSEVGALIREARAAGRTILFSSHVLSEVEQSCDRVLMLKQGKVVYQQVLCELRRQHRIHATLAGPFTSPPEHLAPALKIEQAPGGQLTIETPGELSPLLGWLSTLPLEEVRIEPIGLQAVYDRFHTVEAA